MATTAAGTILHFKCAYLVTTKNVRRTMYTCRRQTAKAHTSHTDIRDPTQIFIYGQLWWCYGRVHCKEFARCLKPADWPAQNEHSQEWECIQCDVRRGKQKKNYYLLVNASRASRNSTDEWMKKKGARTHIRSKGNAIYREEKTTMPVKTKTRKWKKCESHVIKQ